LTLRRATLHRMHFSKPIVSRFEKPRVRPAAYMNNDNANLITPAILPMTAV